MFEKSKLRKALSKRDYHALDALFLKVPHLVNVQMPEYLIRPLEYALSANDQPLIDYLLMKGADRSLYGHNGPNMLFMAVYYNRLDILKTWAEELPELLNERTGWNESLLHMAARKGYIEIVEYLLAQGLDSEAMDSRGHTPLQRAAEYGHEKVVALLKPFQEKANLVYKQQARRLAAEQEGVSPWRKLDDTRIAHVRDEPEIGYRVTDIFNFSAGERTRIYRNLATDQESVETLVMNNAAPNPEIAEAHAELVKAGGTPPVLLAGKALLPKTPQAIL